MAITGNILIEFEKKRCKDGCDYVTKFGVTECQNCGYEFVVNTINKRITESEYLHSLEVVKAYRQQINDDVKNLDSFDKKNEKEIIITALISNNNNRVETAKQLRMSERTLYRKIKKYSIDNDIIYP